MTTSLHKLIDRLHNGQFDARLTNMRASGQSYRQMAVTLRREGYDVTHETLRTWCRNLEETP